MHPVLILSVFLLVSAAVSAATPSQPVRWNPSSRTLTVTESGKAIFEGTVTGDAISVTWSVETRPVEPVFLGYPHGPKDAGGVPAGLMAESVVIAIRGTHAAVAGTVRASSDSLPCLPEGGPEIVRNAVGGGASRLDRGVFDRPADWVLWSPAPAEVAVTPGMNGRYTFSAKGDEVRLVLLRKFCRHHRGYTHWDGTKTLWTKPVAGWCSWMAGGQGITEKDVLAAADVLASDLVYYGYDVVQIDDGFQRYNQMKPQSLQPGETLPSLWTESNHQFPHGLEWMAKQISDRGLTPGIWFSTGVPTGMPDAWYVKDKDGKPLKGPWINWAPNGHIPEAIEATYRETFRTWRKQGWRYFKVDTLRHLLYDSYRVAPEYWTARGEDGDLAFRKVLASIKDEAGPDIYTMACWGVIPEAAGIADGCRIGEDVGPDWASVRRSVKYTAQFGYLNNVLWRNDPDYMCLRLPVEQGRAWASWVALSGAQIMFSDPASAYDGPRRDILRRIGPPLYTRPRTLRALSPEPELFLLDVNGGEAPWSVLGRFAWTEAGQSARDIAFSELGLDPGTPYLVFDFWNERFVGTFTDRFPAEALTEGTCRVWSIRRALDRPQVLSTSRHIGQGAHELKDVAWKDGTLSGKILLPPYRAFTLYVHVPEGWTLDTSTPGGAAVEGSVAALEMRSNRAGWVPWTLRFRKG